MDSVNTKKAHRALHADCFVLVLKARNSSVPKKESNAAIPMESSESW
jgi:hypothetical protein